MSYILFLLYVISPTLKIQKSSHLSVECCQRKIYAFIQYLCIVMLMYCPFWDYLCGQLILCLVHVVHALYTLYNIHVCLDYCIGKRINFFNFSSTQWSAPRGLLGATASGLQGATANGLLGAAASGLLGATV